jgi:hypothetical protein
MLVTAIDCCAVYRRDDSASSGEEFIFTSPRPAPRGTRATTAAATATAAAMTNGRSGRAPAPAAGASHNGGSSVHTEFSTGRNGRATRTLAL